MRSGSYPIYVVSLFDICSIENADDIIETHIRTDFGLNDFFWYYCYTKCLGLRLLGECLPPGTVKRVVLQWAAMSSLRVFYNSDWVVNLFAEDDKESCIKSLVERGILQELAKLLSSRKCPEKTAQLVAELAKIGMCPAHISKRHSLIPEWRIVW